MRPLYEMRKAQRGMVEMKSSSALSDQMTTALRMMSCESGMGKHGGNEGPFVWKMQLTLGQVYYNARYNTGPTLPHLKLSSSTFLSLLLPPPTAFPPPSSNLTISPPPRTTSPSSLLVCPGRSGLRFLLYTHGIDMREQRWQGSSGADVAVARRQRS